MTHTHTKKSIFDLNFIKTVISRSQIQHFLSRQTDAYTIKFLM